MPDPAYLRQPSLQGDTVVFVSDDDLWLARLGSGTALAHRLTAGRGEPATPCLSPDGRWIAYVSRDERHPEVTLLPTDGGAARRLTWLGPDVMVRGWTPRGHVLFVSTHGQPFFRNYRAWTIDPAGGEPQLLPLGQVNHLDHDLEHPLHRRVIGRNTADPARWKRYRGGTVGQIWVDEHANQQFRRLALPGNLSAPMWLGGRLYFLSDADGVGNLHSCRPDGSDLQRHTDHEAFYARHAQCDGARIVYQCGGDLWRYDPASDASERLDIVLPGDRAQTARRFVPAAEHLGTLHLHPQGHSLALEARGQCLTMPLWDGAVHRHGPAEGARLRHGQWLADGRSLVVVSDASGEEQLEVHVDGAAHPLPGDIGRVTELLAAPQGRRVALANHRNELWLVELAPDAGEARDAAVFTRLGQSGAGRYEDLAWSPDGAWLACSAATSARQRAIQLVRVADGHAVLATAPAFRDRAPAFDPAGRYLYFLSARSFDPVADAVNFDFGFPRAVRPYLVALQAGGPPPFDAPPRGLQAEPPAAATATATAPALAIDLEGLAERVAAFPVPEGRYGRIAGVAGGKVVWTLRPVVGTHGRGGHPDGAGPLQQFDFASGRVETLLASVEDFVLAADHVSLLARDGPRLRAIAADRRPEPEALAETAPSRRSGWIDLARVRVAVQPRAEWRQMLREVWRLQRDQFWAADLSGVDWDAAWAQYAPLLERVATRGEFSDLVWELQGELGTSHAYEWGGDHRQPPWGALGQLAARWRWADAGAPRGAPAGAALPAGWELTQIERGDPWEADADSPLHALGVEAQPGERIVSVNGQPLDRRHPPSSALVDQAGCRVALGLAGLGPDGRPRSREVLVRTLRDAAPVHYRAWVDGRRRWVHDQSQGRVGYLHLPDMGAAGYAEFHRAFLAECDRAGLVVDLRYNRGGMVSSLLLGKLARRRIGLCRPRWAEPIPYPEDSVAGPMVALANEHAGSDGDIFSHGFKAMGLGPLVGTRTWGGVVGIEPRHRLVDGSETTQPEYAFWFRDLGWDLENHGTEPDIVVDNAPQDHAAGRDVQLEVALAECLRRIDEAEPAPRPGAEPRRARPPLPPRRR
ncbi:S41 family peptidase [Piscinibacter sakaiensis]|uniref:Tricorn protease homolog n=1 Tax=Piscinibacter sakaiensis TaxID=1547922 RepID=A0A0K8P6L7_PISS1|nr:S41 family peptidase [Piscinibacter sakaiensis]GAP37860.1 tricorn protease homolog [Piscinibacter sakaiensis]